MTISLKIPGDLAQRCKDTNDLIDSGQPMSMQNIADALGLPAEFFLACVGVAEALATGRPVVIDPSKLPKMN